MTDALELSPFVHGLVARASNAIGGLTAMRPLLLELGAEVESLTDPLGSSGGEGGSRSKGSHSDPTALAAERRQHQKAELDRLRKILERVERDARDLQLFVDAYLTPMDPKKARTLTACVWHERAGFHETNTHRTNCDGLLPASLLLCGWCKAFYIDFGREPNKAEMDHVARGGRIMRPAS